MKQAFLKLSAFVLAAVLVAPGSLFAQDDKEKSKDKVKDVEQYTIIRKGDSKGKMVIEIDGDKIKVNGKEIDENDKDGDIVVRRSKLKELGALARIRGNNFDYNMGMGQHGDAMTMFRDVNNTAMLGVTTEKTDKGVEIKSVTKESAAEKMGLKEGDVITKVDDKSITTPDDLSKLIRSHKPGDKVNVTYLRGGKTQTSSAELTKWKGTGVFNTMPDLDFKLDLGDLEHYKMEMPKARTPYGQNWTFTTGAPKLGLSIQDTDDGKGVKVIEVDNESNAAKAGLKVDDIITEVDGKAVNGADAMAKMIRESREKISVKMTFLRGGKSQTVEVKIPRRLKTADL